MASTIAPVAQFSAFVAAEKATKSSFIGQTRPSLVAAPRVTRATRRAAVRSQVDAGRAVKAAGVAATTVLSAGAARAVEAEDIVNAIEQVESFSRQAADVATQAYDVAKTVTEQVVDAATPLVQAATPVVIDVTKMAVNAAAPVAAEYAGQAADVLSDNGVEIAPILSAAKTAVTAAGDATGVAFDAASPYAQATVENVLAQDPAVLGVGAGGLFLLYLLAPSVFGSIAYAARGFAGEFSAAQALDLLSTEDYTLIDVRSDSQKTKSGIPSLPRSAKSKLVAVPVEDIDGKLRGQIRNSRKVEAEIAAIKIAALKRLGKNSRVILVDQYGDLAKLVAQSLVSLGFKSTYIVKDGVDGGKGWISSRLATEAVSGPSLAEVLSPSRIIGGTQRMKTGTQAVPPARRFLLSGSSSE